MSITSTIERTAVVDVVLGSAFHAAYPRQCEVHTFPVTVYHNATFSLDELFTALNRIRACQDDDVYALPTEWQRVARRRLDLMHAPSMSVGDEVDCWDTHGQLIGRFRVASQGWERVDA